jgi:hypothetical protein
VSLKAFRRGVSPSTLSLAQVPDAGAGGQPPEATAREDRWVDPDPELVPQFTTDAADEPISSAETDIPASGSDETPVLEGQLRAPRRWERLLVEAAVIGGRDRWRRRLEGLANDLRPRLSEAGEGNATTLEDLSAFAGYALPLIHELDSLPPPLIWGRTGGFMEQIVPLDEQSRDTIYRVAETVGEAIAKPFLPAAPENGQCDLCDFRIVCGPHEERRTARKAQTRLEPLLAMRGLP